MGVVLFVILLVALGLFLTPRLVSTQWFKHQLESAAANVLHRPVHIQTLIWSWTDGIRINGVTVDDTPSFSEKPLFSIDHASLKIDMGSLLRRRLVFLFDMEAVRVLLVRHKDGRTNVEALMAAFGPPSKKTKEKHESRLLPFVLPEDVVADIGVKLLTIQIDDRLRDRTLLIHDASLRLTAPSLQQKPLYLLVSSEQTLDGSLLPPLRLGIRVSDLLTPSWRLDLKHLSLNAEGSLPGLEFSLQGGLRQKKVLATLGVDLGPASDALRPILSTSLPETSGRVDMKLEGSRQPDDHITFHLDITGKGLSARGGRLKNLEIAPLNLSIANEGVLYPQAKRAEITDGEIRIQEKTRLPWRGMLRQLESNKFGLDLTIGPLMIDLDEITHVLKGIIPSGITIEQKKGHGNSKNSQLAIERMAINGKLPDGETTIQLNDLKLNLPALNANIPAGAFGAKDIRFHVKAAEAVLSSGFPSRLTLSSGLGMDTVHLKGPKDLKIREVELNTLSLKTARMAPTEKGLMGVTGEVTLQTAGIFKGISAPAWGSVPSLSHRFDASVHLVPSLAATIENMLFSLDLAQPADLRPLDIKLGQDIRMMCRLKGGRIQKSGAIQIDAEQMTADLDMGDLFKGHLTAGFKNLGSERLKADGRIALDAGKLLALLPQARRPKGRLTGRMALEWKFGGRRPRPGEIQRIIDGQQPLSSKIKEAPFIQHLKLLTRLKDVGIDLSLSDQDRVSAGGIHTPSPLILELEGGLNRVDLKGELACAHINQLPRLGKLDPSMGVQMGVSLHLEDFKTAKISQSLKIAPLNLEETLTGSLDHLDRIIDHTPPLEPAQLLRVLDAAVSTRIQMDLARLLGDRLAHLSAAGTISAGANLTLAGDNHLTADMNMKASSIDVRTDQAQVDQLQADFQVNRRFRIVSAHHQNRKPDTATPLSRKVLYPSSPTTGIRRSTQPWPGPVEYLSLGPPNLTFDAVRIPTGPLFLDVSNGQIAIDLAGPLPSLDHFQVDVLGGSITGDLGLSEGPDMFMLGARCAFSGLDMRRLSIDVRGAAVKEEAGNSHDSEISGRLTVNFPISDEPVMLLNRMRATVRLTHIGSHTLERFLYALDPYESNEMMVKQRKLLRQGTPRWIELQIKDGNLSLRGEVEVKGALIKLPEIRRFNVALLPIKDKLNEQAPKLRHLTQLLKILVSNTILVNQGEGLRLIRGETP